MPPRVEGEIGVLRDLVRAACRSADACAAAAAPGSAAADPHAAALLDGLREDRRLLLVDLVRCLLLRGLPVPEVRAAMTEVPAPADPARGGPGLGAAERGLERALRRALSGAGVSQPTLELLGPHYLRLRLRAGELGALADGGGGVPAAAVIAAAGDAPGARLLH